MSLSPRVFVALGLHSSHASLSRRENNRWKASEVLVAQEDIRPQTEAMLIHIKGKGSGESELHDVSYSSCYLPSLTFQQETYQSFIYDNQDELIPIGCWLRCASQRG
jgi:hypothetical protein